MKNLSKADLDRLSELSYTDPAEALRKLAEYERKHPSDPNLLENMGAFLIDIGTALSNLSLIERGINHIENRRANNKGSLSPTQWYNLANGYYAAEAVKRGPNYTYDPATTTLVEAKRCYREAFTGSEKMDKYWRAQLHINYANTLAQLGRSVESISEYNRALQIARHPMALGNLGIELQQFSRISRDPSLLEEALALLNQAINDPELKSSGHEHARVAFVQSQGQIREQLEHIKEHRQGTHKTPKIRTQQQRAFVDFCVEHGLFLNFCLAGRPCGHPYEDTVGFSLITPIDDQTTFHRIVRMTNEVKERFAAARLLLFEAYHPPYNTEFYEELTAYADVFDYSVYGIRPAKLKLAFEAAFNILDKIAFFINEYLSLGLDENAVGFLGVWKKHPKDVSLRQEIIRCDNIHLYGLYDIARDLSRDSYLLPLKQMRNNLTHSYLVPHVFEVDGWHSSSDGPQYHIGYKALLDETLRLSSIVRAAVIYLVAFIEQEERKKAINLKGPVATLGGWNHDPNSLGPGDSLV